MLLDSLGEFLPKKIESSKNLFEMTIMAKYAAQQNSEVWVVSGSYWKHRSV